MNDEIALNDIADELLIFNKYTIDTLFKLDNCTDCIALYVFYYKTAKWQKTNTIKANDTYIKKSLKWGEDRIRRTKNTLKENGLIDIVQSRQNGKISGWYIKVSYLIQKKKIEDIKIKVESNNTSFQELGSKNTQNQELENSRTGEQEINALKEYIKCLQKEIEMLKNNNNISNKDLENEFETLWSMYPKKQGKKKALDHYIKCRKRKDNPVSYEIVEQGLYNYNFFIKKNKVQNKFIKHGSTWFNQECWNDDYTVVKDDEEKSVLDMLQEIGEQYDLLGGIDYE